MIKNVGRRLSLGKKTVTPSRHNFLDRVLDSLELLYESSRRGTDASLRQENEQSPLIEGEALVTAIPYVGFWRGISSQNPDTVVIGTLYLTNFAIRFTYTLRLEDIVEPCVICI